jgi:signal peptidase II
VLLKNKYKSYTLAAMKLQGTYRTISILLFAIFNIACDQVTKALVRDHINIYQHYSYIGNHFTLLRVENTGAFLSLGDDLAQPFRFILLTLVPALALLGTLAYVITRQNLSNRLTIGIVCCIGGGIGNLYDRIAHGSVTDFMHIMFGPLQTGVFNVADVSIMIGFGLIMLDGILNRNEQRKSVIAEEQ